MNQASQMSRMPQTQQEGSSGLQKAAELVAILRDLLVIGLLLVGVLGLLVFLIAM